MRDGDLRIYAPDRMPNGCCCSDWIDYCAHDKRFVRLVVNPQWEIDRRHRSLVGRVSNILDDSDDLARLRGPSSVHRTCMPIGLRSCKNFRATASEIRATSFP